MSQRKFITALLATTLLAAALFSAGCKKEEKAQEPAPPAPASAPAEKAAATQGAANYGFETGTDGWNQSAKGIAIKATPEQKHDGNNSLKLSGLSGNGAWNFGNSPKIDLEAGKKYKITGWVFVQAWDKTATPPLLKVGISQNGKWASNAFTNKYNIKKMNEWQQLSGTFTAPADGQISGQVALEKGTQDAIKATVYLDDIKLEAAQ